MPYSRRILPHGKKTLNAQSPNYYTATGTLGDDNILTGTTNSGSKSWTADLSALSGSGGGGTPGGSTTQIQYNNGGAFAGTSAMTYDSSSEKLVLTSTQAGNASLQLKNTQADSTASGLEVYNQSSQVFQIGHNNNTDENYVWGTGDIPLKFATSGTERMRISATGNIGIGTVTPSRKLHVVEGSNGYAARFEDGIELDGTNVQLLGYGQGNLWVMGNSGNPKLTLGYSHNWNYAVSLEYIKNATPNVGLSEFKVGQTQKNATTYDHGITSFFTSGSERVRIDAAGNLGIGTTNPSYKIDAYDAGTGFVARFKNESTNAYIMRLEASDSTLDFQTDHIISSYHMHLGNDNRNWYIRTSGQKFGVGTSSPKTEMTLRGALSFLSGSTTSAPGYKSLWASGSGLYWGDEEVYTNAPGTSEITGGGSSGQVTYFDGSSSITGSNNITFDGNHLKLLDDKKLILGTGDDMQLYHNGSNSYVTSQVGDLNILNTANDADIKFKIKDNTVETEVMRIVGATSRVGIGTDAPNEKLEVVGGNIRLDDGQKITFGGTTTEIDSAGSDLRLDAADDVHINPQNEILFFQASSEKMRLKSGNLGIGTTNPSMPLHVSGNDHEVVKIEGDHSAGASLKIDATAAGGTHWKFQSTASGSGHGAGKLSIQEAGTNRVAIIGGGSVGIGTTSPGAKLEVKSSDGFAGYFQGTSTATIASDTTNNHYLRIKNASTTDATTALLGFQLGSGYQGGFVGTEQYDADDANNSYANLVFGTKVAGTSSPLRRMTILHNGKVGIGTSAPRDYLEVDSSANDDPAIRLTNSRTGTSGSLMIQHRGSSINIKADESNPMRFSMGASEKMRITSSGTGIGTVAPTNGNALTIAGTMDVSNNIDVGNRVRKSATYFLDFSNTSTGLTLAGYQSYRPQVSGNAAGNGQDLGMSDYPWDKVYSQGLTLDNQTGGDDSPGAKTIWVSGSDVYWGTSKLNAQSGGGGTPGGSDTQVQFNDGSSFGGDAGLTYAKATDTLTVASNININANLISGSSGHLQLYATDNINLNSFTGITNFNYRGTETFRIAAGASSPVTLQPKASGFDLALAAQDGTSVLHLDSTDKYIGIGTTAPESKLHIAGGAYLAQFSRGTGDFTLIQSDDTNNLIFAAGTPTSNTEVMTLNSTGVGIGTTTPGKLLHIDSDTTGDVEVLRLENSNASTTSLDSVSQGFRMRRDGDDYSFTAAKITAVKENGWTSTASTIDASLTFSTLANESSFSEKMRIDSAGNVGIGTTSPVAKLHISEATSADVGLVLSNSDTGHTINDGFQFFVDTSKNAYLINREASDMKFYTSNAQKMIIDSAGNVGIGTGGPDRLLHIHGGTNTYFKMSNDNTGQGSSDGFEIIQDSADINFKNRENGAMTFGTNGTTRALIDGDGLFAINTTSPSDLLTIAGDGNASTQIGAYAYSATDDKTAKIFLNKSANSTAGSHTAVANGDYLGLLAFRGSDGDSFEIGAQIRGQATQDFGAAARGADLIFSTVDNSTTTLDDRMAITQDGKVGIGLTNPSEFVHIKHATTNSLLLLESGDNIAHIRIKDPSSTQFINSDGGYLSMGTNSSLNAGNLNVSSDGAVGIGTVDSTITRQSEGLTISGTAITDAAWSSTTAQRKPTSLFISSLGSGSYQLVGVGGKSEQMASGRAEPPYMTIGASEQTTLHENAMGSGRAVSLVLAGTAGYNSGGQDFGNFGSLLFHGNSNWSGDARRWMISNAWRRSGAGDMGLGFASETTSSLDPTISGTTPNIVMSTDSNYGVAGKQGFIVGNKTHIGGGLITSVSTTNPQLTLAYDGSNYTTFTQGATDFTLDSKADTIFKTNGTEIMRVDLAETALGIGTATPSSRLHVSGGAIQKDLGEVVYLRAVHAGFDQNAIVQHAPNTQYVKSDGASPPGAGAIPTELPLAEAKFVGLEITIMQRWDADPEGALTVQKQAGSADVIYEGGSNSASANVSIATYRGANKTFMVAAAGVWVVKD